MTGNISRVVAVLMLLTAEIKFTRLYATSLSHTKLHFVFIFIEILAIHRRLDLVLVNKEIMFFGRWGHFSAVCRFGKISIQDALSC